MAEPTDPITVYRQAVQDSPVGGMANLSRTDALVLLAELDLLRDLVGSLADPDPCQLDHHGYCQAHFWTYTDPPCPNARAREMGLLEDDDA